ncbi:MAG: serine/threonine protein kinase [Planctomycetes bacterium]|nr:serine/threonine protein kinase [Planctomycetota bacterium]
MVRLLAEGGMGQVYEATQFGAEGFEKTVAVKTILESYSTNPEFVRLFIGEAKLVADLVHENIVQVYHLDKFGPIYYIAMEYVDGINLEQFVQTHIARGTELPVELGAFIISRVCRGLEYAHNKRGRDGVNLGIVHRDVSPKNVMLTSEGVVKLTDFGIAKARQLMEQEEGEVLMGKVEYMSPEQAQYLETDSRSDLFSLGIVMFELLTGHHIFETDDLYETLNNVKRKHIPRPREFRPDIPEDLDKIVMKALERDVKRRFQSAGEMGHDLEYYMYHDRYGPTNVTLSNYLKKHFLGKPAEGHDPSHATSETETLPKKGTDTAKLLAHRADTLFGEELSKSQVEGRPPKK